jgi:hypothetical protein
MASSDTVRKRQSTGNGWRIAGLAGCLAATALATGTETQIRSRTLLLRSGLHSFHQGAIVRATLADVGTSPVTSRVKIEFWDDTNRLVASTEGWLTRMSPIRLDYETTEPDLVQLRMVVVITGDPDVARPMTTLESIDRGNRTVQPLVACGPPSVMAGPPNRHEGPQTVCHCPDLTVTVLPPGQ